MAKKQKQTSVASSAESSNLKGTFIMVMILGVLMVGAWFGAYWLFISR
ncbi:cytochrome c oxidase subunit 2A [Sporosarcina aquimarina]|uniref:Cytochrome c oxidase subunit 2A n=1 Tax=Sporosarcina aquimarina TaxID=114975 RepID=A0ABU4G1C7_9BACL|nr:cytochrome c oxidase subunit 2A [Sporosarcina aquimarina]MDW0110772.1 cytochrome c oxidase subunit 2A [Sporosarcina aquimarina]